jgi:large subunit ribosomal protein L11
MAQTVDALVEGGKATAAPPLGPALGPMGVNIGQVVAEINKKTAAFKGMQVPIKVIIEDDKSFKITVGTPPASSLVKKEAGLKAASGNPKADMVADLKIEQVIKIAKMKSDDLMGATLKTKVNEILGTMNSMGVMCEGERAIHAIAKVKKGEWAEKIASGKTEITAEELKALEEERKKFAADIAAKKAQFEATAEAVLEKNKNATRIQLKHKLIEAGIPAGMLDQYLPAEQKK